MRIQLIIVALFITYTALSQVPEGFPHINIDKLEAGKIKSERTYTKESLFGYMNGGAELYLEYGFDRLVVSEIDIDGTEYKLEVYKMDDPEAAYGIYSVSVFRCDTSGHLDACACQTQYQLQLCKGEYYISIINNSGARKATEESIRLANILLPLLPGNSFEPGDFISDTGPDGDILRMILVKGELGLFNGAFDWNSILDDVENYTGLVLETADSSVLILKFSDSPSRDKFFGKHGIMSSPVPDEKITVDQNTSLRVSKGMVIITREGS
ncbi:MAG: DUF6599 family protein [Bacteroidota bacterium]